MTILISVLVGAALILAISAIGGKPAVIAIATLLASVVAVGILADVRQALHDRVTGQQRLREMAANDPAPSGIGSNDG